MDATHYILWERPVLSWSQRSAEGKAQGASKASQKYWPPAGYNGSYIPSSWKGYILYIVPPCMVLALCNPQQCGVYELWSDETQGYNCMRERNLCDFLKSGLSTSSCNLYLCVSVSQVSLISASSDLFI